MCLYSRVLPKRATGDLKFWAGVVPGDSSATLWTETHSYDDLPKVIDPTFGWFKYSTRLALADRILDALLAAVALHGSELAKEGAKVLAAWDRSAKIESRGTISLRRTLSNSWVRHWRAGRTSLWRKIRPNLSRRRAV